MKKERFKETVFFEDIPDTGLEFYYADLPGLLDEISECSPNGAIEAHLRLTRRGKNIWAEGTIECELSLNCHRCLEPYPYPLSLRYAYLLIPREVKCHMKEEISLKPEDLDVAFFDGVRLELFDVFREQVLLSLPVKQLCKEDCKGLCPSCGFDFNQGDCACSMVRPDNPFSVLRKLKFAS